MKWSTYKIQLHGIEWIVSLSADWDQSPTKKKKKKISLLSSPNYYFMFTSGMASIAVGFPVDATHGPVDHAAHAVLGEDGSALAESQSA